MIERASTIESDTSASEVPTPRAVPQLNIVSVAVVRHAIALCVLGEKTAKEMRVGAITLFPHQTSAVHRIRRTLREFGGVLLCDTVGLGKTYTALAAAAAYHDVLILAPAVLGPMWQQALGCTGMRADFTSLEALSRGKTIDRPYRLIIVDEAHHLRNPATKRYAEVARLCISAPVLLISATPIHNSRVDLASLAALFMGHRVHSLNPTELSRLVVRRATVSPMPPVSPAAVQPAAGSVIPRVDHAPSRVIATDDTVLDRIAALPPPVPPAGGGNAASLVVQGLARQWVSSSAALVAALKRRMARSHALIAALDAGRYPTRSELVNWVYADDALQLAFPELLPPADFVAPELRDAVAAHLDGLRSLAHHVCRKHRDDDLRAAVVRGVIQAHPGEKIVVFATYKETAAAVYRSLAHSGGVALMASSGGVVAGGALTRQETLEHFAPQGCLAHEPPARDDIRVLVTTDILSEGVNLQDASVVIHLDLPWTAARMEQRIGRVARLGSRHETVTSYALHPSERAEALLKTVAIVERKARAARTVLGPAGGTMNGQYPPGTGFIEVAESVRVTLQQWLSCEQGSMRSDTPAIRAPVIAAVSSQPAGAIAACIMDGRPTLAALGEALDVSTDAASVSAALALATGSDRHVSLTFAGLVQDALVRWYERERAAIDAGVDSAVVGIAADRRTRAAIRMADAESSVQSFADRGASALHASLLRGYASAPMPIALEQLIYGSRGCFRPTDEGQPLPNAGWNSENSAGLSVVAILLLGK